MILPKIGTPIHAIDTPALLLDRTAFEHNLRTMADFFRAKPVSLRPHVKSHSCPQVALRQIELGAVGITCAKVSEAEVMAAAGIKDILIASEIVGAAKIERLCGLTARCALTIVVDDPVNVRALSQACLKQDVRLGVLVDMDIGLGRCGVRMPSGWPL